MIFEGEKRGSPHGSLGSPRALPLAATDRSTVKPSSQTKRGGGGPPPRGPPPAPAPAPAPPPATGHGLVPLRSALPYWQNVTASPFVKLNTGEPPVLSR
ncbi:MAG: hypothetical protein ACI80K_000506 [Paracoccaceae bacterium]|jgi:hypothetical protein